MFSTKLVDLKGCWVQTIFSQFYLPYATYLYPDLYTYSITLSFGPDRFHCLAIMIAGIVEAIIAEHFI